MIENHGIEKVALLTDGIHPLQLGGMQKHSYHLLLHLVARGIQVLLYHPKSKADFLRHVPADVQHLLTEVRIHFDQRAGMPGSYLKRSYAYALSIAEHLKQAEGIDFIYAQGFAGWALAEQKRKGEQLPPMGVNFHGLEMYQHAKGFKQTLIQWMFRGPVKFNLRHAERVYSLGGGLTRILEQIVDPEKISEIPIAIDSDWIVEKKTASDGDTLSVLFIGRYERRKGIEELNQHISSNDIQGVDYQFVGPIPASKQLKVPRVTYHGKVMDIPALRKIIDSADLLIVPSYAEGMPTVILEAMSRGLLVLASNVGAVSALVDARNGRLMQAGSVSDITQGIEYFHKLHADERQRMSDASIEKVKQDYTWADVIERMLGDMAETIERSKN